MDNGGLTKFGRGGTVSPTPAPQYDFDAIIRALNQGSR